jgi:hypothetical protein
MCPFRTERQTIHVGVSTGELLPVPDDLESVIGATESVQLTLDFDENSTIFLKGEASDVPDKTKAESDRSR